MEVWLKRTVVFAIGVAVFWIVLTIWVERTAQASMRSIGDAPSGPRALIVYDPDPIYDLDAQVCRAFAEGLAERGFQSTVATVAAATDGSFDLHVFCANTYNWRPDRAVTGFIEELDLVGKPVVAITLGAGSTEISQRLLEEIIKGKHAELLGSRSFWIMRPNDEARTEESNIAVAVSMAREWGRSLGEAIAQERVPEP